ncbi:hypothetical protein JZ751_015535, partial [Albula glossodonta]
MLDEDPAELRCCLTVEHLNASGQATKRQVIRQAAVILGRNGFQEIVLRVHDGGLPRSFETISPLQQRDLQKANELQSKVNAPLPAKGLASRNGNTTAGQQVKRPRPDSACSPKPALSLPVGRKLSKEQVAVLSAVLSGKNVFFTGSAGTGKSFLLKQIVGSLPPKSMYATTSTGVAACHIGGTTLHSFSGIGSGSAPVEQCLELAQRPGVLRHWTSCRHLIIDEISMVEAQFFDKLEMIARSIRRSTEPFGGIQLIVCGDFLQLPPVTKGKPDFCFQLTDVRRQTDQTFISLLQAVRVGRVTEEVTAKLMRSAYHSIERDGILATRLCTHKDDVELTNENKLQQLPDAVRVFEALDSDPQLVKAIDSQSPVGRVLQLKVGAQVMLTKNLNVEKGLVNVPSDAPVKPELHTCNPVSLPERRYTQPPADLVGWFDAFLDDGEVCG